MSRSIFSAGSCAALLPFLDTLRSCLRIRATLVLEIKGQDSQENRSKGEFLAEWVKAVNAYGEFGTWGWDVSRDPKDIAGLLEASIQPSSLGGVWERPFSHLLSTFLTNSAQPHLERMTRFGKGFLRQAIHEFVEYYHRERNHQELGNRLIIEDESGVGSGEPIQCRQGLGGMLNYYYRQAA